MASILDRAFGPAKLDAKTYEEVKRDTGATGQASLVAVLGGLGAGLGAFFRGFDVRGLGLAAVTGAVMALILPNTLATYYCAGDRERLVRHRGGGVAQLSRARGATRRAVWGAMLTPGTQAIEQAPWMFLFPGLSATPSGT